MCGFPFVGRIILSGHCSQPPVLSRECKASLFSLFTQSTTADPPNPNTLPFHLFSHLSKIEESVVKGKKKAYTQVHAHICTHTHAHTRTYMHMSLVKEKNKDKESKEKKGETRSLHWMGRDRNAVSCKKQEAWYLWLKWVRVYFSPLTRNPDVFNS